MHRRRRHWGRRPGGSLFTVRNRKTVHRGLEGKAALAAVIVSGIAGAGLYAMVTSAPKKKQEQRV